MVNAIQSLDRIAPLLQWFAMPGPQPGLGFGRIVKIDRLAVICDG